MRVRRVTVHDACVRVCVYASVSMRASERVCVCVCVRMCLCGHGAAGTMPCVHMELQEPSSTVRCLPMGSLQQPPGGQGHKEDEPHTRGSTREH